MRMRARAVVVTFVNGESAVPDFSGLITLDAPLATVFFFFSFFFFFFFFFFNDGGSCFGPRAASCGGFKLIFFY